MIVIRFANKKLETAYYKLQSGVKMWNQTIAKKYIERVNALQNLDDAAEFSQAFPHYSDHALIGNKSHLRAFILHDRWRVEYEVELNGKGVIIREVSNHYGD